MPVSGVHVLLAEWSHWMQAGSMSARTVTERVHFVQRLDIAVRQRGGAVLADWQALADYLRTPSFSAGTRATYYANLQAWFSWLVLMQHRADDPTEVMRAPRQPKRRPRPVTVEQLGDMLRTPHHHRTTAMLLLAAYESMRCHEVAKFRGEDIVGDKLRIIGKGDRYREVPMHDTVRLIARTMPERGWWFPSHVCDGQPVTAKSVSKMICELMRRADVPATAHALRHFYGTESLRSSGGNLELVRELMGHANITTTAGYTQIDDREKAAAVAALPVPAFVMSRPAARRVANGHARRVA